LFIIRFRAPSKHDIGHAGSQASLRLELFPYFHNQQRTASGLFQPATLEITAMRWWLCAAYGSNSHLIGPAMTPVCRGKIGNPAYSH